MKPRKIAAILASAGILTTAGASLAACGSTTAAETFAGSTTNVNTVRVPITASGAVSDHGSISLNTKGDKSAIVLSKGQVDVTHSISSPQPVFKGETVTQASSGTYTVSGGTGAYNGATGSGTYKITFSETFAPGSTKTQIESGSAHLISGLVTFHASGPLSP